MHETALTLPASGVAFAMSLTTNVEQRIRPARPLRSQAIVSWKQSLPGTQEHQKVIIFPPSGQLPSPPSRKAAAVRLTMCRDNSSHMICGLDVDRLLADTETATHALLPFCDETRGTILISLLSTSMDHRLFNLERSTSARLPPEHDAFLKMVWLECNLHHEGLEASLTIQATWANLVLKLATASVQSGASSRVSERTMRAWRAEPAKAYRWLREQRARSIRDDDAVTVTSWTNNPRDLTDKHKSILRQHIARGDDEHAGYPKAQAYIQRVADTLVHNALNKSLGEMEAASKGNMEGSQEDVALQRAVMDEVFGEVTKRRDRYGRAATSM